MKKTRYLINELNDQHKNTLLSNAFEIRNQFFHEMDYEEFIKHALDEKVKSIFTLFEVDSKCVGYTMLNIHLCSHKRKLIKIFTMEIVIAKEWRGKKLDFQYFYKDILLEYLKNPWIPMYLMDVAVNPGAYIAISRNIHTFWPHPNIENHDLRDLALALADNILSPAVSESTAWLRKTKWVSRNHVRNHIKKTQRFNSELEYFKKMCPNHHDGEGILFIVPVNFINFYHTTIKGVNYYLRSRRNYRL